jgi:hypothetical protein
MACHPGGGLNGRCAREGLKANTDSKCCEPCYILLNVNTRKINTAEYLLLLNFIFLYMTLIGLYIECLQKVCNFFLLLMCHSCLNFHSSLVI